MLGQARTNLELTFIAHAGSNAIDGLGQAADITDAYRS
jgi:hypothetical protein